MEFLFIPICSCQEHERKTRILTKKDLEEDILGLDNVDEIDVNLRELVLEENTLIEANQLSPEQLITSPEQSQIQSYQNPPNSTPINIQTPETDENVNQIGTRVTSNEAQPRLNGRYVLKELNNQQNVNQPNVSNSSSITIQKLTKKRGRKPLPRDENGKIIRQQNFQEKNSILGVDGNYSSGINPENEVKPWSSLQAFTFFKILIKMPIIIFI
ncbi:hypothetical protein BpHYR1_012835 [Brachionus plicatilis]|uniref:Uncharacterized protein n=1 Tax=Brachionus plicatilis TaxID=10195 RepID=A0A3M7QSA3_BRAPC|nr:hypothetical protein BpHYR1_012835 [Brachionus plicatilis]